MSREKDSIMKQVLVVGAGPAGLVTAITLGRLGVPTLVIEKRSTMSPFPRATGISLRSMELFRSWGLEPAIRAGEIDVGFDSWTGGPLATSVDGVTSSLGFPTREQARELSPTTSAAVPQDYLEPVLLNHVRSYESVEVRFDTELVSLDQDDDGVTALVCAHGSVAPIRVRYVVGADGSHSAVRASTGIAMEGPDDLGDYYTVLFRAPLMLHLGQRRHGLYMVGHLQPPSIFVPSDNRDRWVFAQPYDRSRTNPLEFPPEKLIELIRAGAGVPDLPVEIERVGAFTFAAQVARTYRDRNAFLVGDAAHRVTPRGGTGMNTAIQDGLALGWRLVWVLRGWADPTLLDEYEAQRRPIGIRNTARSANVEPRDNSLDYLDDLGGRIAHAWVCRDSQLVSTLDLIGSGLTLITGPSGRVWSEAAATVDSRVPVEVHGVDAPAAEALGIGSTGAVLVGPDAIPIALWSDPAADRLVDAIREAVDAAHAHAV
jgi:putative polyketide hydroxylase